MDTLLAMLRDPIWQAVGVFVGIGAAVGGKLLTGKRRRLDWEVVAAVPFVRHDDIATPLHDRVTVLVDGQKDLYGDIYAVAVRVRNTGREPLEQADYAGPIALVPGEGGGVYGAAVRETRPVPFSVQIACDGGRATVAPVLLNPGASFTVKLLTARSLSMGSIVMVNAIIKGTEVRQRHKGRAQRIRRVTLTCYALVIPAVAKEIGAAVAPHPHSAAATIVSFSVALSALIGIFWLISAVVGETLRPLTDYLSEGV